MHPLMSLYMLFTYIRRHYFQFSQCEDQKTGWCTKHHRLLCSKKSTKRVDKKFRKSSEKDVAKTGIITTRWHAKTMQKPCRRPCRMPCRTSRRTPHRAPHRTPRRRPHRRPYRRPCIFLPIKHKKRTQITTIQPKLGYAICSHHALSNTQTMPVCILNKGQQTADKQQCKTPLFSLQYAFKSVIKLRPKAVLRTRCNNLSNK